MPALQPGPPGTLEALLSAGFFLAMDNGNSWLKQTSWERRQAWAKHGCSPHSPAAKEGELSSGSQEDCNLPLPFLENGIFQGSGSNRTSFEDDLSLGAEAPLLLHKDPSEPRFQKGSCWPSQPINLDHSIASSAISGNTNKTSSSISEVLDLCEVDAETILCNLGFIQEAAPDTSWIPPRFFSVPSQAEGIDFQAFLRAQVQRIEMEDPCLMLANRFKQVQTLAVTTDAFFTLYSYVSKTPVQMISPAPLFWNLPEMLNSWNLPSNPNDLSLIQPLQKALSRMCLYTAPREGSPSGATSVLSPMRSMEEMVWEAVGKMCKDKVSIETGDVKNKAYTIPAGNVGPMANASSDSTAVTSTSEAFSCFSGEAPSHSGEMNDPVLPRLESWLSHCSEEAGGYTTNHLSFKEPFCSPPTASPPEASSEESNGERSTEQGSTPGEKDDLDVL